MKRFPEFFVESIGDIHRQVSGARSPENALPDSIIFLATPKAVAIGLESAAQVLVVSRKQKAELEPVLNGRTLLVATNVELAMAKVISAFFLPTPYTNAALTGIHPTAVVHPSAELGKDVRVGPNAFVGANVKIGAHAFIGACSVIEDESIIGEQTVIHPQVYIGHSTQIGVRCEVHPMTAIGKEGYGYAHDEKGNHYRIPHQGRVILEDDVHVGSSCTIDRATFGETRIGFGTKIDNQIHIAHNCQVGRNALMAGGFAMAGSTKIGNNFVGGGATAVTGHIEICDNVQVAGFSAVSRSITEPGQYGGNPIQPLSDFMKTKAMQTRLAEMYKQLRAISKKLGLDGQD
jgi:UDP-3-O-[3-hydroxymyristoyl] glucosamine N-acyltransferase